MPKLGSFSWPGSVTVTRAIDGELYSPDGSQPPASDSPFYLFFFFPSPWVRLSMRRPFTRSSRVATEEKLLMLSVWASLSRRSDFGEASIMTEEKGKARNV